MALVKKCFLFFVFLLFFIGAARFCHHKTHGFRLSKIENNFCLKDWSFSGTTQENPQAILQQEFHYFNRGLQSFAFLSQDGKYVLKIFNNRYQRRIAFFDILAQLPLCKKWATSKALYNQHKLMRTFTSYQIASKELRAETGLLYAHLEKSSDLPSSLTLIDPLHIAHTIDPNVYGFVIQHKADLVYPTLLELIRTGHLNEAKHKISSLIDLLLTRCHKGIADNDPLIRTNFGFCNERPISIDLGPFSKDPTICDPAVYRPEIRRVTESLSHWLQENAPQLVPFLDQELEIKQ